MLFITTGAVNFFKRQSKGSFVYKTGVEENRKHLLIGRLFLVMVEECNLLPQDETKSIIRTKTFRTEVLSYHYINPCLELS
jgi:hypothetical protein